MDNIIKIGYFRKVSADGRTGYISFNEYYGLWDEESKANLKRNVEMSQCRLYCACCLENNLELSVTSNYVVRVKSNHLQSEHAESCPKSVLYNHWNDTQKNGIQATEDEQMVFNIALPSVAKSTSTSSSTSSSSGSGDSMNKRTGILDIVITINKMAWELQGYSIKKKIREARRAEVPLDWEFKDIDAFNRLIFGISNRIYARVRGEVIPFINLAYRKDAFYNCDDWRRQWFVYAIVEKISTVKPERRFQYVTVKMPSLQSKNKAVIRIETELFNKIFNGYEEDAPGTYRILSGYICRKSFDNTDGSVSEWMELLKGVVVRVNQYGLYCDNLAVAEVANYLCEKKQIYRRPYLPLENYGSEVPSFIIERYNRRDIIIDMPLTDNSYAKRQNYVANNAEFDIVLITQQDYRDKLHPLLYKGI